jgi:hypothetical protein
MDLVRGISLNSNLYSNNEQQEKVAEPSKMVFKPKQQKEIVETTQSKMRLQRNSEVNDFGFKPHQPLMKFVSPMKKAQEETADETQK